jgi:quercetin dioxygenase-like cupin family protein
MIWKQESRFVRYLLGLILVGGSLSADGQQTAPTETRGVAARPLVAIELGPEIEGMSGRQLRTRLVTFQPGGVFGIHNHKDRPGTVYVLEGKIVEHRLRATKEYGPGEFWSEDKETSHWLENVGTAPAVLIAVDIFKQP